RNRLALDRRFLEAVLFHVQRVRSGLHVGERVPPVLVRGGRLGRVGSRVGQQHHGARNGRALRVRDLARHRADVGGLADCEAGHCEQEDATHRQPHEIPLWRTELALYIRQCRGTFLGLHPSTLRQAGGAAQPRQAPRQSTPRAHPYPAVCRWQIATASASDASSELGFSSSSSSDRTMCCTCVLSAAPYPVSALLISRGEYSKTGRFSAAAACIATPRTWLSCSAERTFLA